MRGSKHAHRAAWHWQCQSFEGAVDRISGKCPIAFAVMELRAREINEQIDAGL